jgi:predicted RNA-binding Zn ribbon-like protein
MAGHHGLSRTNVTGDALLAAPGELELVRAFVNTRDLELGLEALAAPAELAAWLSARGLLATGGEASSGDLRCALALREGLRALLLANATGDPPPPEAVAAVAAAGRRAALHVRPDLVALALVPAGGGVDAGLARLLAVVVLAQADGTWPRLKACPGEGCRWALYDRTRSRTRTWCAAAKCGARSRARAYRARARATAAGRAPAVDRKGRAMPQKSPGPSVKDPEQYEALREQGESKEKAARIANTGRKSAGKKGGKSGSYEDWTKEDLRKRAAEIGIEGRSKMSKGELVKALRDH